MQAADITWWTGGGKLQWLLGRATRVQTGSESVKVN